MSKINLVGQKFGRLEVIVEWRKDKRGRSYWICLCDCGEYVVIRNDSLKNGRSKSCGCLYRGLRPIEQEEERFWSKVDMRNPFECWPWLAAVRRKDEGYGAFYVNRQHHPASRVAYILIFGSIPTILKVCHRSISPAGGANGG